MAELPRKLIALPISQAGTKMAPGFLVSGVSPRRVEDLDYMSFLNLLAGHIGTSVANARAYEEERKHAESLAEIDRAKTLFFCNVSHEFRTPLTLILGPLEDALASGELPSKERERLDTAHRNSLRLLKLVNSLLDFSRIEAGRTHASYAPTDLAAYYRQLRQQFPVGLRACRTETRGRLPAAWRTGLRGPRHVGEDRA